MVVGGELKKMHLVSQHNTTYWNSFTIDLKTNWCHDFLFITITVLHEIKNEQIGDVLLAGVFDGHAGTAASKTCAGILPSLFTTELLMAKEDSTTTIRDALENAWETTCNTYRNGCDANGECVADYDPTEGILFADTGSTDLVGKFKFTTFCGMPFPPATNQNIQTKVTQKLSLPYIALCYKSNVSSWHHRNLCRHINEPKWYQ